MADRIADGVVRLDPGLNTGSNRGGHGAIVGVAGAQTLGAGGLGCQRLRLRQYYPVYYLLLVV